MSQWIYIDAYTSSIPAAQKQALLNLVYSDVQTGQIQTLTSYQAQLSSELAQLQAGLPTPLFNQIIAPYQTITNSANFNAMESQAISALQILYNEVNLLDASITNYNQVTMGNLDAIEATIKSLETQVDVLELLASNTDGYISSVYDSFSEQNSYRLNRADTISTAPYIIPDIGFIPAIYDAQVTNKMLQLPLNNSTVFGINSIYLENQYPVISGASGASSEDIPTAENPFSIQVLLNNNPTQYWAETVDIKTLYTSAVSADVIIEVAGTQQINNITINPFTRFPYQITSIQYTKNIASGVYFEMLDDTTLYPITIGSLTNIQFSDKYADSIKIHIVQQNYSTLQYIEQGANNTIAQIFDVATGQAIPTAELTDPNSYYFAMTSLMQNLLSVDQTTLTDTNTIDVYEFLYGMTSLSLSQLSYSSEGIWVSQGYTIPLAAGIGLNVDQAIPNPLTSIEYDVLVEYDNISGSGAPIFVSNFAQNILPAEVSMVEGEVLDGTYNIPLLAKWTAQTRFSVHDTSTVQVFQNNILLSPSLYSITQDPITGLVTIIILDANISPTIRNISFYTINYIPAASAYIVPLDKYSQAVINLRMFLRSMSPNSLLTPSIGSYSLKFQLYTGH